MSRRLSSVLLSCLLPGAAALASTTAAHAQTDFYKDKQLRIISSSATNYAEYSRVLARHMQRHIPGQPVIIVQVMAGASGLIAANHLYTAAPRDGLVIAATHGQIPTENLLNAKNVQFDPVKFSWIGSITKDTFVGYVSKDSPVQSLAEAKLKELTVGGQAVGSMSIDMAILGRELFGLKFKIVTGYKGSADTKLALARGELSGHIGTVWSEIKKSDPYRLKEIKIITQFGFKPHPELPDVPLFIDLAQNADDRQVIELMLARQETAKPYFGPPDIPADRLAILRNAFDATIKDPDYLAEAERLGMVVDQPMSWQEITALVKKLQEVPPSVARRLNDIFDKFRDAKR